MTVGLLDLGDHALNLAAIYIGTPLDKLDGMTACTLYLRFQYGSGGSTCKAYCQVSLDQETTWVDIACASFTTASEAVILNFSGLTPKLTQIVPTDGALADDTAIDGVLSDRMRLKIVTTGTYAGQTVLSGRVAVR